MARIFPFPETVPLIRERKQSQTFRKGWEHLHAGEILIPVVEHIGALVPGKKYTPILPKGHVLEILRIDFVAVQDITRLDVDRCGYPEWTPTMYQTHLMRLYDCGPLDVLTRIYFAYLEPRPKMVLLGDANFTVMPAADSPDRG